MLSSRNDPQDDIDARTVIHIADELDRMMGAIERKGMTAVALAIYWKNGRIKAQIGLARGKKQHDKRAAEKDRDWSREKGRILKGGR